MKYIKIAAVIIAPAVMAGIFSAMLYNILSHYNGIFSHDVLEAHTQSALLPFIYVVAILAVFLPGIFYMANILFPVNSNETEAVTEIAGSILTAQPEGLTIGQIFTSAGSNCQLRVKTIKQHSVTI